jgi:hypothetical protein
MVFAEFDRRARWTFAQQIKLGVQMLTTFAYASLGISVAVPVLKGSSLNLGNLAAFAFGLVCAFMALYLVPQGERDGAL